MQGRVSTNPGSGMHIASGIDNRITEFDVSMLDSPVEGGHPITLGGIHVSTLA
jgi:hypothetical protein